MGARHDRHRPGAAVLGRLGALGVVLMRWLVHEEDGWWVYEQAEGLTYGTTGHPRRGSRVLCPRDADRSTAAGVAVGLGLITREELEHEEDNRRL